MSGRLLLPAANGGSAPHEKLNNDQTPPHGTGSKLKRVQGKYACNGCRKRKCRCDGIRPTCSHCEKLEEDCEYNTKEGETPWSALQRKIRALEREQSDAHVLLALIRSQSELRGQEIFSHIRAHNGHNIGALVQQIRNDMDTGIILDQEERPEQQAQLEDLNQCQERRQTGSARQPSLEPLTQVPVPSLPPLRSIIDMSQGAPDTVVSETSFRPPAGRDRQI